MRKGENLKEEGGRARDVGDSTDYGDNSYNNLTRYTKKLWFIQPKKGKMIPGTRSLLFIQFQTD